MSENQKSKFENLLMDGPKIINIGLREFAESLQGQDISTIHVEWSPPAGGDIEMEELLDRLL